MHLRFFLSSPGDVLEERAIAQQVIEQELPKDPLLRGQVTCEAVRWDDPNAPVSMPAALTPQEAVNRGLAKPSQCDVVIVILWSRMGTPLPADYLKPDGSRYESGTEWEYEDARGAEVAPHVLVYRRTAKVQIDPDDPAAIDKLEQRKRVQRFFERFRNPDGSLGGGYVEYETPPGFRERLRTDLRAFIQQRLIEQAREAPRAKIRALPPFGDIARGLRQGRVVPFIGASALCAGRPANAVWSPAAIGFLPSGAELSRFLAEDVDFPSATDRDDLARVASFYEAFQTRATLRERLRQVLKPEDLGRFAIPSIYRLLAEVPVPQLIVTVNFDTLIERALQAAGKPYDLVVYPADRKDLANAVLWWPHGARAPRTPAPNELDIDLETTTVVFKMHGSVQPSEEWDGFVITEEDHVEFLSRVAGKSAIPSLFSAYLHDRSLLFLGCSLEDWNLRLVLRSLSRYFSRRMMGDEEEIPSWAINDHLTELEVKLWRRRGVYPYQLDLDEFVAGVRARWAP
ncbi:MAG: SIR2 family protein [Thiotrichales bacterium]